MDKLRYYEVGKQKCQSFISNIYMLIEQIDMKINDLKRIKRKTDIISNKFEINNCYNYNLIEHIDWDLHNYLNFVGYNLFDYFDY